MTSETAHRRKWLWGGAAVLAVLILVCALAILSSLLGADYLMDIWWFEALGYSFYYWQRVLYNYTVFGTVTLLFFLIFYVNFRIAARSGSSGTAPNAPQEPSGSRPFLARLHAYNLGQVLFALLLSVAIALPIFRNWEKFLFFIFGRNTGVTDPYFGRDIAFYLFSFPVYTLVIRRLLLSMLLLVAGLFMLYAMKHHRRNEPMGNFSRGEKLHLGLVTVVLVGLAVWDFLLQRYGLVYGTAHQPLFRGPGYVEMHVALPLIWGCIISLALAGVALISALFFRKGYSILAGLTVIFLIFLALRHTEVLPEAIQTYIVKPNEIDKENPYIASHIQATLDAYKLTAPEIQIRPFTHQRLPAAKSEPRMDDILRNVPVWDAETLSDVFHQLQELRTYYVFPRVSVGRYSVEGRQQQVFLSPREIEFDNLPGDAHNWINKHLVYTHGFGLVMTPASQTSGDANTWYLHNIPPVSSYGLTVAQPRIYYGLGQYTYSFAPNNAGEMDYPKGSTNVLTAYDGRGGIPVTSLYRKLLMAYALKNEKIFFSTKINEHSKLLIRRNIIKRIHHLVPFLHLDGTPYIADTSRGLFWIVDAYTTSKYFPGAAERRLGNQSFNYIRNAVKVVVDAYNGSVNLYRYDDTDPIIEAYDSIYPGLIKPKDRMPEALKHHVRYPKDLFDIQMQIYAKYHQTDPHVYYQQEDLWTFAEEMQKDNSSIPLRPYYVTLDLIHPGKTEFLLLLPLFPKNRDNLRAVAVAGCDPESYGKIVVYDFPKGQLVYGPAQIEALINQDPKIAEQFTLWDQAGSSVVRGKMIILLVGNSVLFIQPVYIKSVSRVSIPELQRIIMSEGEVVVMEPSIQEAYAELRRRAAPAAPPPPEETTIAPPSPESPPPPGEDRQSENDTPANGEPATHPRPAEGTQSTSGHSGQGNSSKDTKASSAS